MVEPESICLPGKALARDATRRLRFVVRAAGWLHFLMLHRRTCCSISSDRGSISSNGRSISCSISSCNTISVSDCRRSCERQIAIHTDTLFFAISKMITFDIADDENDKLCLMGFANCQWLYDSDICIKTVKLDVVTFDLDTAYDR